MLLVSLASSFGWLRRQDFRADVLSTMASPPLTVGLIQDAAGAGYRWLLPRPPAGAAFEDEDVFTEDAAVSSLAEGAIIEVGDDTTSSAAAAGGDLLLLAVW